MHPTADKLYCEKIDVGEGAPREIASGLRGHISLEDMQRRRVVIGAWPLAPEQSGPSPASSALYRPSYPICSCKPQAAPPSWLHFER